jgi:ubiquinone/menaquinone biosynthesis C-methylase UbiE|tara:strand:- start:3604 stop:4407 length:804 start_codon:yes stop_codon:yes gene_type:complete
MSRLSDAALVSQQYKDASNLKARLLLHDRFSTNKYGWHKWIFDQFHCPANSHILELGCGSGALWKENRERIPSGWDLTLSDLSRGMLEEARGNIGDTHSIMRFKVLDAQSIPFQDETFDVVIANSMLYHVPDSAMALSEICRVLKPDGTCYAATGGKPNGPTMADWIGKVNTKSNRDATEIGEGQSFTLENGESQLSAWFSSVTLSRYQDALEVTEVQPLVNYVKSMISLHLDDETIAEFERMIQEEMERRGVVHIAKSGGMFAAKK